MNENLHKIVGAVEKILFNRRVRKVVAKHTKLRHCYSVLCDLCVKPLRPLRLMDFNFLTPLIFLHNVGVFAFYPINLPDEINICL
jgi:hypothetical protein